MAAFFICSEFGAPKNKLCPYYSCFSICYEVMGLDDMIFLF